MATRKFKITDKLPFVAHIVFLFSSADLDLEDSGVMYSKFEGKVMSHLEVYTQTNYQPSKKTKYIFRQNLKEIFPIFILFLKITMEDILHQNREVNRKIGSHWT